MDIDILEALAGEVPARANRKCKIQRWLDNIPDETPGKADLVATLTTTDSKSESYRTREQVDKILYRLGLETSVSTVGDHRARTCRCYV